MLTLIALAVIALLLIVFYRTKSDVHITMLGLGVTLAWTLGAQAWLSPGGADILDPDNIVADTVPGTGAILSHTAAAIVRRPLAVLGGAVAVTVLAIVAATSVDTTTTPTDFLPRGTGKNRDLAAHQAVASVSFTASGMR